MELPEDTSRQIWSQAIVTANLFVELALPILVATAIVGPIVAILGKGMLWKAK